MDILDQLNSQQTSSKNRKKPSIMSNLDSLTNSSPLYTPPVSQLTIQKQNIFIPRNDQHASYQHLKNNHFDILKSNQTANLLDSQKDALSVSEKMKKFPITQSLGVIFSESSEESQNSVQGSVSRRIRQKDKTISNQTGLSPIQQQELKEKLAASELINSQYALNVKQLQKELIEKQQRIKNLEEKIEKLENRNRQDRLQILEQQSQILKMQTQKISSMHAQEKKRIQQVLTWEYEHKSNSLQQQISSLTAINQRYQKIFQSESELSKYKNMLDQSKQKEDKEFEVRKHIMMARQKDVELQMKKLQKMKDEFFKQKLQNDHKLIKTQNELNDERIKIKKERLDMIRQQKQRQQQIQEELRQKIQDYEQKTRKIQLQRRQLQLVKAMLEKQKQQSKKLTQMALTEYKKNMQDLIQQKQKVYAKQKQLIQKIQIVEARNKNYNRSTAKICHVQNEQHFNFILNKNQNIMQAVDQKQKSICSLPKTPAKESLETTTNINFINKSYIPKFNHSSSEAKKKQKGIYKLQQFYQ